MRRVVVTTLHEEEAAAAASSCTVQEQGDGVIVGLAAPAAIDALRARGILVEELPDEHWLEAAGFTVTGGGGGGLESFSGPLPPPGTVLLACDGPIRPVWLERLGELGVAVVERAAGDQLIVRVEDDVTMATVAGLDWVIGMQEMLPAAAPEAYTPAPLTGPPPAADEGPPWWDVKLERIGDREAVVAWAGGEGVEVVGTSPRRARLRVPAEKLGALRALGLQVEPYVLPGLHNDLARELVGVAGGARAHVGGAFAQLTGAGQIVGVADSGLDDQHPDFQGRILALKPWGRPARPPAKGDTSDNHGHGTHVAGTILGDGSASGGQLAGVAPGARLFLQSVMDAAGRLTGLPVDLADLFQEAWDAGVRIHNNSWGSAVRGRYTGTSEDVDQFVAEHPEMLVVISAGNEGTSRVDPATRIAEEPGRVQPLSLGAPATSKNALVVGARRSSRAKGGWSELTHVQAFRAIRFPPTGKPADVAGERVSSDSEQPAGFSSRGPCLPDRRIKPDVLAPGTDVISARSADAPDDHFAEIFPGRQYGYMSGTSMAAPVVSGLAALVREYYVRHRQVAGPSAALLKATIINGTQVLSGGDAGGAIPNAHQGFGAVNLSTTLPSAPGLRLAFVDVPRSQGFQVVNVVRKFTFDVTSPGPLRICLAFTDVAASGLQNDLDLIVEPPGLPRRKLLGNPDLRGGMRAEDTENNVEIVRIADAAMGRWTVAVVSRNILAPQGFALVVLGNLTSEVLGG